MPFATSAFQRPLDRLAEFIEGIGLADIFPGAEALGFFYPVGFGKPAGNDGFLAWVQFENLPVGVHQE